MSEKQNRKPKAKQLGLGEVVMPFEAQVEYRVNGAMWRCNHFDRLAAEVGLTGVDQLPLFHDQASATARGWTILRRLFGIQPVLPSANYNLDDLRQWEPADLCAALLISKAQLQEELAAVRGAWTAIAPKAAPKSIEEAAAPPREEFHFAEEELLKKHGFAVNFDGDRYMASWFAGRVKDFEKLLLEKVTAGLAHNALMTELTIRQFEQYFSDPVKCRSIGTEYRANLNARQGLDKMYREQIDQILEKAPWASSIAGKYAFAGVLSDLTQAIQNYEARGDTQLIDGMFTAMEIKVECRRSVQTPAPRYRAGLVVYVAAAKAGLWNPNWEPSFTASELKRLDQAWQQTMIAGQQADGVALPDLEKNGAEGEYEELRVEGKVES